MFTPDFYDYYKEITRELESRGASVHSVLENYADKDPLYRFFWLKNKYTRQLYAKRLLKKEIDSLADAPDIVLIIRGEALGDDIMVYLKSLFPKAVYIMYQWDSVKNNPNALEIEKYFDRILTFDPIDAKDYGWIYRPLFYLGTGNKKYDERKYDWTFISTLYYKRAKLFKILKAISVEKGYRYFDYLYSSKLVFYLHRYIMKDKRYIDITEEDVKFTSLDLGGLRAAYLDSKCLVDFASEDQTGLTMRTIESIGYGCKLITNNNTVLESDFYDPANILVYDIDDFSLPEEFLKTEYLPLSDELYRYYSLAGWVDTVLS